jgi:hypothetical protein
MDGPGEKSAQDKTLWTEQTRHESNGQGLSLPESHVCGCHCNRFDLDQHTVAIHCGVIDVFEFQDLRPTVTILANNLHNDSFLS